MVILGTAYEAPKERREWGVRMPYVLQLRLTNRRVSFNFCIGPVDFSEQSFCVPTPVHKGTLPPETL